MTETSSRPRFYIRRVRLNRDGYTSQGYYYGNNGIPLWQVHSADDEYEFLIRGHRDYARCAAQFVQRLDHERRLTACNRITATDKWN